MISAGRVCMAEIVFEDDNPIIVDIVAKALMVRDHTTTHIENGGAAPEVAKVREPPSAFLDWQAIGPDAIESPQNTRNVLNMCGWHPAIFAECDRKTDKQVADYKRLPVDAASTLSAAIPAEFNQCVQHSRTGIISTWPRPLRMHSTRCIWNESNM